MSDSREAVIASTRRVIENYREFNPKLRAAIRAGLFPDTNRSYLRLNLGRIDTNKRWLSAIGDSIDDIPLEPEEVAARANPGTSPADHMPTPAVADLWQAIVKGFGLDHLVEWLADRLNRTEGHRP